MLTPFTFSNLQILRSFSKYSTDLLVLHSSGMSIKKIRTKGGFCSWLSDLILIINDYHAFHIRFWHSHFYTLCMSILLHTGQSWGLPVPCMTSHMWWQSIHRNLRNGLISILYVPPCIRIAFPQTRAHPIFFLASIRILWNVGCETFIWSAASCWFIPR